MREAIDETGGGNLADTTEVIGVNRINVVSIELRCSCRDAVEHLVASLKEMHGTQNKIEFVPMFLDPLSSSRRTRRIIVELDAGTDS